jgi:16S rRNA (guanine1207-N2)-methyltransferase
MSRPTNSSPDHYFSRERPEEISLQEITCHLAGLPTRVFTARGVFSADRLDRGTELLIGALDLDPAARVLDLGCGWGPLAITAARLVPQGSVVATDVNPLAVELTTRNAEEHDLHNLRAMQADGLGAFDDEAFDVIVTNPPVRAGWRVVFPLIDDAPRVLGPGGVLYLVARTRQGADTVQRRIIAAFGNSRIVRRGSGYKVFLAERQAAPEGTA